MDFVKQRFGPLQNRRLVTVQIGMHRRPRLLRDPVGRFNEAENQGLSVDESDDHERDNRQANGKRKEPVLKIRAAGAAGRRFRPGEDREKEKEEGALAARGGGGGHGATLNKLLKVVFMNRTITLGK